MGSFVLKVPMCSGDFQRGLSDVSWVLSDLAEVLGTYFVISCELQVFSLDTSSELHLCLNQFE